jgi:alpha-beta hydrolase superfamily lysophospholipase
VATVPAADGVALTVERFDASRDAERALIFIHGIGNYPGPYRRFARALAGAGTTVYLPHLRGHGSSGTRGAMGSPARVLDDIGAIVAAVRADHPDDELILGGESMGGLFALAYTASDRPTSRRPAPDRLLLLVPALWPNWRSWFGTARDILSLPLSASIEERVKVVHAPINGEPTRSEQFSRGTRADPNMLPRPSFGYLLTIARLMLGSTWRYPKRVTQPCLIMQAGADRVLDARAAHALAARMPQAEIETIADAWHNVLWDPTAGATTARVAAWLNGGGPLSS